MIEKTRKLVLSLRRFSGPAAIWIRKIGPAPIAALTGFYALLHGIALVHKPTAWIVAGLILLALAIGWDRSSRVKALMDLMRQRDGDRSNRT